MFQPAAEGDEHEEHGWSVEECLWTGVLLQSHGHGEDSHRVDVGDCGGHADQNVHVSCVVPQRPPSLHVEVPSAYELENSNGNC